VTAAAGGAVGAGTIGNAGSAPTSVHLAQRRHDVLVAQDVEAGLGQSAHEGVLVDLVQLVALVEVGADAAADHQHRDAVEKRLADAARGVRQARRRHDHQRADLAAAGTADRVGHERAAPLVRDQPA